MADLQASAGPPSGSATDILIPSVISKRQRRPSVRLNEIGDQSAALSHDFYLRRNKQWKALEEKQWKVLQEDAKSPLHLQQQQQSKNASDLGVLNKVSKTRPLGNLGNGNNNGLSESQGQIQAMHEDPAPSQNMVPDEGHLQMVQLASGQINGKNMQLKIRNASKKARLGKGKRGGTRGACVVGKFARTIRVSPEAEDNEKGSGEDGFGEPLSNASYDVDTPEGFRDFELDTSDSPGDMKETSALQVDSPENALANLGPSECHQMVGEVYGNERDEFISERRDRGKSGQTWAANNKERPLSLEYMDGNGMELPSDTETRSKHDANEFMMREPKCETDNEPVPINARHNTVQDSVVRTWLNGLGLGRYAQLFEMHEVDNEVLPLLTLDDLRDMGINAVGSRRKMYNAIQKLQKSFTV
eukprot:Gb_03120 [translate_table: standard]